MKKQKSIKQRFAALGFEIVGTGGNCTAWSLQVGESEEVLVTGAEGHEAPVRLDELGVIGVYDADSYEEPYAHEATMRVILEGLEEAHRKGAPPAKSIDYVVSAGRRRK